MDIFLLAFEVSRSPVSFPFPGWETPGLLMRSLRDIAGGSPPVIGWFICDLMTLWKFFRVSCGFRFLTVFLVRRLTECLDDSVA